MTPKYSVDFVVTIFPFMSLSDILIFFVMNSYPLTAIKFQCLIIYDFITWDLSENVKNSLQFEKNLLCRLTGDFCTNLCNAWSRYWSSDLHINCNFVICLLILLTLFVLMLLGLSVNVFWIFCTWFHPNQQGI